MIISSVRLYELVLHCKRPFKISSGTKDACRTLLIELGNEAGQRGFGEAIPSPLLTDETFQGCQQSLTELLFPMIQGRVVWDLNDFHASFLTKTRAKSARCAIDIAIHGLQAQMSGISLARLLGTSITRFPTNYSIGIETLDDSLAMAKRYVEEGYDRIKLKVGIDPEADIETICRVSETLPPGVKLRLDANGGWSRRDAVTVLREVESRKCPIELVEQPTIREDFDGLRFVRERTAYPIAADESIQNLQDAKRLLQDRCVDILNLKLMKTGGIRPALDIVSLARAHGCQLMIGGMVGESWLSVSAAAALASAYRFEYADLDADILLADSPFADESSLSNGLRLAVPDRVWDLGAPTLGVVRDDATLIYEWKK